MLRQIDSRKDERGRLIGGRLLLYQLAADQIQTRVLNPIIIRHARILDQLEALLENADAIQSAMHSAGDAHDNPSLGIECAFDAVRAQIGSQIETGADDETA